MDDKKNDKKNGRYKSNRRRKKLFEEKDWGDDGWGLESDILASSKLQKEPILKIH